MTSEIICKMSGHMSIDRFAEILKTQSWNLLFK